MSKNMATARTTGNDAQVEELRRRNVAGQTAPPVVKEAQIKEKSKEKVYTTRDVEDRKTTHN